MSTITNDLQRVSGPLVCRGVKEICEAVGINHKRFKYYVEELKLPAFKIEDDTNVWLASYDDLAGWIDKRKAIYFNNMEKQ